MQREFEALLDMQRFDAGELDYAVLDRHVARLTQLSQVVNSGITVFDMYRRRHVFSSYNFPDLFRYDMDRIASEDSDYFSARIHPDDLPDVHRNGIDCLRFMLGHKELIDNGKFLTEYRIEIGGRYVRVVEQFQVLECDRRGNIWLTLSVLDMSPNQGSFDGARSQLFDFRGGRALPFAGGGASSDPLSEREREILRLIGRGRLSKEIAVELSISVHTVNTHRQRILEKLRADNSMEAVRYAAERGLLD